MSKYPPRRAGRVNLVVGVALVVFSLLGLMSVIANIITGPSLAEVTIAIFLFVFIGGYEIGKYSENRISKQYRATD